MKSAGWQGRGRRGVFCLAAGRQQHAAHSRFGRSAQIKHTHKQWHKHRGTQDTVAMGRLSFMFIAARVKHGRTRCAAPH